MRGKYYAGGFSLVEYLPYPLLCHSVASKPRAEVSVSGFASLGRPYSRFRSAVRERAEGEGSRDDCM